MLKISVVVPTYNTDLNRLEKLVQSIQTQTMNSEDYEIIFIDDGSPNPLFYTLNQLSIKYDNVQVHRITNSGWGSRPRNVGIGLAKGEYILFMDHDDIIYPQSFEKVYDFAKNHSLDVVNPKEVRTKGWAWGWEEFSKNKVGTEDISLFLPMTPHKFYKRKFLLENDIFFNEGSRVLWEDVYFNVMCYSKGAQVGILADYPVYHWVATGENNSSSFGRDPEEKWNQINRLMDFFIEVITQPKDLNFMLTHWYRTRVLGVLGQWLQGKSRERIEIEFAYTIKFREKYESYLLINDLVSRDRIRDYLLKNHDLDTLLEISNFEKGNTARSFLKEFRFIDNKIHLEASAYITKEDEKVYFSGNNRNIRNRYSKKIENNVNKEVLSFTESELADNSYDLSVKGRNTRVAWKVKDKSIVSNIRCERGLVKSTISATLSGEFCLEDFFFDNEDLTQPWDIAVRFNGYNLTSHRGLAIAEKFIETAMINGIPYVAYKNKDGLLSIDLNNKVKSYLDLVKFDLENIKKENNQIIIPIVDTHVFGEFSELITVFLDPVEKSGENVHNFTDFSAEFYAKNNQLFLKINDINVIGNHQVIICYKGKNTKLKSTINV